MKISRIVIVMALSVAMVFGFSACRSDDSSESPKKTVYQFHSTVTYLATGTDGSAGTGATYCYFGDWPQTIKAANVTVDEKNNITMGSRVYYLGSDNNYYAKCRERTYADSTYSDGTMVKASGDTDPGSLSEKYFKVEPIKWRVLNPNASGNKILFAENILTALLYDNDSSNYKESTIRKYLGSDFLDTAFTTVAQRLIALTVLDNSEESTNPADNPCQWNSGKNDYICITTSDKIFLLSEKEVTTTDYGFIAYSQSNPENKRGERIKETTDYAIANYAGAGSWWTRSPSSDVRSEVHYIKNDGSADACMSITRDYVGIVPALSISAGN